MFIKNLVCSIALFERDLIFQSFSIIYERTLEEVVESVFICRILHYNQIA